MTKHTTTRDSGRDALKFLFFSVLALLTVVAFVSTGAGAWIVDALYTAWTAIRAVTVDVVIGFFV